MNLDIFINLCIGEGGVISNKIYFCDSRARLKTRNYELFVQNCRQPIDFNMTLFVSAIAPSIRPLLTKMQGGLVRPN